MSVAHCTGLYTQYFLAVYVYFLLNVLVVILKLKACNLYVAVTKAQIICAVTTPQAAPLSLYMSKSGNFKANSYQISLAHWMYSLQKNLYFSLLFLTCCLFVFLLLNFISYW